MFDLIKKQLELQSLGKAKQFYISQNEYDEVCKLYLFEEIRGKKSFGEFFCEKYNENNHILLMLSNQSAKKHVQKFYVK